MQYNSSYSTNLFFLVELDQLYDTYIDVEKEVLVYIFRDLYTMAFLVYLVYQIQENMLKVVYDLLQHIFHHSRILLLFDR